MIEVVKAIGFMTLGGFIVLVFENHAWNRYQQGKKEGGFIPPSNGRR